MDWPGFIEPAIFEHSQVDPPARETIGNGIALSRRRLNPRSGDRLFGKQRRRFYCSMAGLGFRVPMGVSPREGRFSDRLL